jgi:hypothetical protein
MYENILAVLTADEAKPLGIVKPLHCSLFHVRYFLIAIEFAARSKSGFVHIQQLQKTNLFQTMTEG